MKPEEAIKIFRDWGFSQGRPSFADAWGIKEHTRFCIEFIKRQLSGNIGLTGPLALFFENYYEVSGIDGYSDVNCLMAYYTYMNKERPLLKMEDDDTWQEINVDAEQIRNVMVLI